MTQPSVPTQATKLDLDAIAPYPATDGLLAEVRRLRAELDQAREQLAQAGIGCNCCFVDGHTRRCGRDAEVEVDVPPFGVLAVSETCKQRINGTTPAASA